jgi:MFS family permease
MRWVLGALIVFGASAGMIAAILRVRRRAPEGGYFNDGDRASGVFGVLATGFALLLGFVIFLAFTKYDGSRAGAEAEALAVVQLFETSQLMPPDARPLLAGEVECYARSVVNLEWPAMEEGHGFETISPWGLSMFRTLQTVEPATAAEQSAYDAWLGQTSAREEARRDRLHAAEGVVPQPMWIVLLLSAVLVLVYLLFFADSGERAVVQGLLAGSVTAVVVASLLVLSSLNRPYDADVGGIRPVAMQRSLEIIGSARVALNLDHPPPCDAVGQPL